MNPMHGVIKRSLEGFRFFSDKKLIFILVKEMLL